MTPSTQVLSWQTKARIQLSRMRAEAGRTRDLHAKVYEEISNYRFRQNQLRLELPRLQYGAAEFPRQFEERVKTCKRDLDEVEIIIANLLREATEIEKRPNPLGNLPHTAESILNALGVSYE